MFFFFFHFSTTYYCLGGTVEHGKVLGSGRRLDAQFAQPDVPFVSCRVRDDLFNASQ